MIDQLLEKVGLKYEDLSSVEKETLNTWLDALQKGQVSVETIREYVTSMKDAIAHEVAKEPSFIRILIFKFENPRLMKLQARLENYILLDAFLTTPEKAKQQMESAIAGMVGHKS